MSSTGLHNGNGSGRGNEHTKHFKKNDNKLFKQFRMANWRHDFNVKVVRFANFLYILFRS